MQNKSSHIKKFLFFTLFLYVNTVYSEEEKKPFFVLSQPASELSFFPVQRASAVVEALNDSKISAEISGPIVAIHVKAGETVKKGSALATLQCTQYDLILRTQKARALSLTVKKEFANYQFERTTQLSKRQAVSEELLKQFKTNLDALQAEISGQAAIVEQAKKDVNNCIVRSPFDAVILSRIAQVGEFVTPGSQLLRIVAVQGREVLAEIQHSQVASLEDTTSISFISQNERFPLSLRVIIPSVNERGRTREARLIFKGLSALPGTAGEIHWSSTQPHLPSDLLVRRNKKLGVFIIENNEAIFIPIPSAKEGRPAPINFPKDYKIITKGRFRLQAGDIISNI